MPVINVEGIGPKYADKLNAAGIKTTKDLLVAGRKPAGREDLAKKTGIAAKLILEWVRDADFVRVKGVSEEYSDLLDEAEVRDVVELAKQDPKVLHPKLLAANEKKKLVRRPPSLSEVTKWVNHAKKLPKVIEY
nr:DUF4332 domain-containing protein [Candidatus Freyarchaeota archaeon]